jgi:hypothetical protein
VSVTDADLQNLLNNLGLGGLSQVDLQRTLAAVGVASPTPAPTT